MTALPADEAARPSRAWLWWLGIVLASGAGLVVLAVLNLWSAVRDADARAILDAQRNALAMTNALDGVLRAPEFVFAVPESERFAVERSALVVPPQVEWLEEPPHWQGLPTLSIEVEDRIQKAEVREFTDDDALGALADLRALLDTERLDDAARRQVELRAAWIAHRSGNVLARDVLRAGLEGARGQLAVSAALLCAACDGVLPDALRNELVRMPPENAPAVLERLAARGLEVASLQAEVHRIAAWRDVLRTADRSGLVGSFVAAGLRGPVAQDGRLVALHGDENGDGRGYVIAPAQLTRALSQPLPVGVPTLAWTGDVVFAADGALPDDAFAVVPGFVGVAPLPPAETLWSSPTVLGSVVGGLALLFGAGLFFSLRAARREAAAMSARADFLTVVTHELKTPLASIRLLAEMLEEDRVAPERVREYYGLLWSESARLTMLIENVLDLGRMERGERSYDLRGQSVEEVVGEAVDLIRPLMEKEAIAVLYEPWNPPVWVDLDRGAMLQALLNVLDNARKYGAEGRRIEVATRPGVTADGGEAHEVLVRDYGAGVAPHEREGIFLRFKRGAQQMDGSVPGVGLGLYLARSILRRHGGELLCEEPGDGGGGVSFRFVMPVAEQPLLRSAFRPPAATEGGAADEVGGPSGEVTR